MKSLKDSKGFTLVELLIVMAVVIVLAAAALPKIGNITASARESNTLDALSAAYTEAYTKIMAKRAGNDTTTTKVAVENVEIDATSFEYITSPKVGGIVLSGDTLSLTAAGTKTIYFTFSGADTASIVLTKISDSSGG